MDHFHYRRRLILTVFAVSHNRRVARVVHFAARSLLGRGEL